jgi:hypothetical protein
VIVVTLARDEEWSSIPNFMATRGRAVENRFGVLRACTCAWTLMLLTRRFSFDEQI